LDERDRGSELRTEGGHGLVPHTPKQLAHGRCSFVAISRINVQHMRPPEVCCDGQFAAETKYTHCVVDHDDTIDCCQATDHRGLRVGPIDGVLQSPVE
jgi:hypothetical protein